MILDNLNFLTLAIMSPILVMIGILGFIIPIRKNPISGAVAYNLFHILFGIIGAIIILAGYDGAVRAFNIGYGLVGLYQAVASFANLFPKQYFKWTRVDDTLHVVAGAILLLIGVFGQ